MLPLDVGLEMVAYCPLIPGIDKHKRVRHLVDGLLISKHGAQQVAVGCWGGAVEDSSATVAAAGDVDPGGGDAREARAGHWRAGQHGGGDGAVGENSVGAEGMGSGQAEFVEQLPADVWLQWRGEGSPVGLEVERGIEAIELRVAVAFGVEAFHLH